jgi:hypothetical protein
MLRAKGSYKRGFFYLEKIMAKNEIDKSGWNWAPVPAKVIMSKNLDHIAVRVYAYLLWRAGNKGDAWPGVDTISKDIGASGPSIKRAFRSLILDNWIRRFRKFGRSSTTFIFENQEDCKKFDLRSYHRRSDVRITGDLSFVSQEIPLNKSHINESKKKESTALRLSAPLPDLSIANIKHGDKLLEQLKIYNDSKGRRAPKKFQSPQQMESFQRSFDILNGDTEKMIVSGIASGCVSLPRLMAWVAGCAKRKMTTPPGAVEVHVMTADEATKKYENYGRI